MKQEVIHYENTAVVISKRNETVLADFYINAGRGIHNATATSNGWSGKTVGGAKRWAQKKFCSYYDAYVAG